MSVMSQYQAKTYDVKIVPDAEPNADGEWITVICRPISGITRWNDACHILEATGRVPRGHHIVQYREAE